MSEKYESVSSESDNDFTAYTEVSNEAATVSETTYQPESIADLEEDGFDVATHGGGRLEDVPNFPVTKALTVGLETIDMGDNIDLSQIPPAYTLVYQPVQAESQCGPDDRRQISNTASVPWRMVCQLIMTTKNGERFKGTGWFIGPRTVMTAGHCLHFRNNGGWAKQIEVIPGMNGSRKPYGSQIGRSFRSVKGWTDNQDPDYDYGCIILPDDNLGKRVGWFGFAALSDGSLTNLLMNNSGYSGDKPSGTQWYTAGRVLRTTRRQLFYYNDTFAGNSGGPVWRYRDGKRHGVGIHAYGGCPNKATRITRPVFDLMKKWKNV